MAKQEFNAPYHDLKKRLESMLFWSNHQIKLAAESVGTMATWLSKIYDSDAIASYSETGRQYVRAAIDKRIEYLNQTIFQLGDVYCGLYFSSLANEDAAQSTRLGRYVRRDGIRIGRLASCQGYDEELSRFVYLMQGVSGQTYPFLPELSGDLWVDGRKLFTSIAEKSDV